MTCNYCRLLISRRFFNILRYAKNKKVLTASIYTVSEEYPG